MAAEQHANFEFDTSLRVDDDHVMPVHIRADYVENGFDGITHIMTISVR